ncbi:uncharacterized protein LOC123547213 isoform X2 [Mercenaria mercenaria]|nr:uncharacterized protein LOC123547213 isoform X2 [Mercenaria mercenaria]XP_053407459.1 uncharacterized protein LOC123547213 isoform X2 [Mercenaria mercenaria]
MAKSLHDKNVTESDRIVEKLETWLDHHNETRSMNIVKPRERRSIIQHDMPARKHIETKMVLIQSLGNAGKQRSLKHIKSYMEPNVGVTAWRRAAIHSLRHFSCNESAHALLTSAVHDGDDIVRKTATSVLKKHPKSDNFTVEHENVVLSKNYSYPIVSRVRRSLLQTLEQGIQVLIKPPGIEWDKTIGTENIGASFGLHIRNILDLKLALLSGHFMVDVYDGAYAEAHVGMINFQVDIVKAYVCFKGRIAYDLNVLKDFGINSLSDLVHIYDKIVAKIVTPITDAVKAFRDIIMLFKGRSLTDIVNTIVQTVKNLPTILGDVAKRLWEFVQEIFSIAGSTILEEIKIIIQNVRNFVDGVKQDVLKFYNDIVDAVTMGLPYISKKIVDAFNLIVSSLAQLLNNPMQAITSMSRGISNIKMAITMAVDVKNKVIDACMFLKGRAVEWLNTAKQIPSILKRLGEALKKLIKSITGRKRRDLESEMTTALSDGVGDMKNSLHNLESDLRAKWDKVLEPLKPLIDIVQPFVDEFKAIMDLIKGVKWSYKKVKEVIETSKSLVQKVFGPKFHRSFPTERRKGKGGCKDGVWPTTTQDTYQTTGVDLALGKGQSIVMPVNGILHVEADKNRVVVQPIDPEFIILEVIIENINPELKFNGKQVKAGDKIGRATKAPKCEPNYIHVSVRQARNETVPDADYDYTDPGPFLDRLVPIPKWIQECNDHEFRYIGQTFESGETDEEEEPDSKEETVERDKPDFDELDDMLGDEDPAYRPDDPSLYDPESFGDSLKKSLQEQTKKFADFFKTALFGKGGPKVPNILDIVNVNNKTVTWVFGSLTGGKQLYKDFSELVDKLRCAMVATPVGNPATMSLSFIKKFMKLHGVATSSKGGDISNVADSLMATAGKMCPNFKDRIAAGFGHVCTVHDKCCLGITCSVPVPLGAKTKHMEFSVSVDPGNAKIQFKVNGISVEFGVDGVDEEYNTGIKLFGMKVYIVANAKLKNSIISLTAEVKLCTGLFATCLPPIELFHNMKFDVGISCQHKRSDSTCSISNKAQILEMTIPTFVAQLGEYQLLDHKVTKVLEDVRETVVKELMKELVEKLGAIEKEFKNKVDFCVSANIPVPPFDIIFFDVRQHFMVGPVPLSLGFGAGGSVGMGVKVGLCVLSMTTQLTLTPWVGGKVWGDAAIDIFIARGGIRLIGYLMETKFPMTTELVFSKYPIDVGAKMDMVLTPLRLQLKAFAELNLFFTRVTVFEGLIWQYAVPTIRKNIFHKKKRDDDPSPPAVLPATINERRKRSGTRGCIVQQISGRPYYDPAFRLEMHAQDEVSEVKLFYAIGTHRGGTNVVDWTDMGGNSLMVPSKLPGGIPLYWSVKAKNSQGLESISQCSLDTYDSTLPDGRVEHSYTFSSHPNKIIASVIAFEDSPLVETHYKAVGFSPGQFGSQFVDWQVLRLDHSTTREGAPGALKHFTIPREGKLVAWILQSQKTPNAGVCAQRCIDYGSNCVSFDYEHHSETCDFHDVVQGANAYLRISGTYSNYERLGSGYHTPTEYSDLPLTHGSTYFVNAKVRNVLGYDAYLLGEGTMVDFTPPEPGTIKNARKDILQADKCTAAVTQQCIDVTWKDNHRIIIDGPGSGTVFNGHEPLFDELYTLTNHYVSANWKGFHDDESGLWGFTWAVGRDVCGTDVVPYKDPYAHLTSKKFWTDSGFQKGIHLTDGPYYVTVQALNGAELGGSLVTTVCHSTPFVVDTTPPVFNGVTDIIYDEDFDLIAIYYNATDHLSKIADAEFGLGKTKYDVQLKPYSLHASMDRDDPFVAVEELGLQEGIPAWIRIRVTNNVELFTAGHGDEPILIDKSPPIAGHVLDGDRLRKDRAFQADDDKICAQWVEFFDPESGLDRFLWGVGTKAGEDNVVKFHNLTRYEKSSCAPATLAHNRMYYSTVFAYNNALNSKSTNSSSDGVLVDVTPPISGHVKDGKKNEGELSFSSETVSKFANWDGYYDPESGIDHYKVDVVINNEEKGTFEAGKQSEFEDHTISMEHQDQVVFTVYGVNGADLENASNSNGFMVDLTTPVLRDISDNNKKLTYQSDNTKMDLTYEFEDPESGIKEYRIIIYETKYGVKQKFWPRDSHYNISQPPTPFFTKITTLLNGLSMTDGAQYSLHVTALNRALLASSHETSGVTVDTTEPQPPKVHIGLFKDEEELDEDGNILHDDQNGIRISWSGRDSESGIINYRIAIGTTDAPYSILNFTDYGKDVTAYIQNIHFETTSASGIRYVVTIIAVNGAGLQSKEGKSKPIFVQKANVPGIVFDGRNLYVDEMYTTDYTSIAASFYGFESESCNIISYDWAIGTTEYGTDIQTYTNYGLVMLNETHGQCQIHIELFEDTTYYITIRAVTGCRDEYILSSSDGITLDRIPPEVTYEIEDSNDTSIINVNDVIYQGSADTLSVSSNVTDKNSVASVQWALGSLPLLDDRHPYTEDFSDLTSVVTLTPGQATFITTNTSDKAGNVNITSSFAIIADSTAPLIRNFDCTKYMSSRKSLLTCTWDTVEEYESLVDKVIISIGSNSTSSDILDKYVVPRMFRSFSRDLNNHIDSIQNMTSMFVNVRIENVIGHLKTYGREVVVDRSVPATQQLAVVTNIGTGNVTEHQRCQLPRAFAELHPYGIVDEESGIDHERFEVAIGYTPYGTNILEYTPVKLEANGIIFVDGFSLHDGAIFHATLRVYNHAGLKMEVTSDSVVISQSPVLSVSDGDQENDIDYQSVPNLIQGKWIYSDLCPVKEASWSVSDLTGKVLFDFQPIPSAAKLFYNDEVALENGMKYIATVKTVDFLGRTKIARSDGVSVRIQPPLPGLVRDGLQEDLNYQFSTSELSANWDNFGDGSNDPTQSIHHYEVAIGNDRRYAKTRSNIHFFVDVGLNTSFTFKNLNLTSKLVKFYITVRSYSMAGGYTEGYSNGIRVGFNDDISAGSMSVSKYQSSTTSVEVSWTGFRSDIDIIDYIIGISSHDNIITNDTRKCTMFYRNITEYDISELTSVNKNEYKKVNGLSLSHGDTFYVTVIAKDEAGMCIGITSEQILVDTSPPNKGSIFVNNILSQTVLFADSSSEIHIRWTNFTDKESGVMKTKVFLFQCKACGIADVSNSDCFVIGDNTVENDDKTAFYELELDSESVYYVVLNFTNGAQLVTHVQSESILIDTSGPLPGKVKIAKNWYSVDTFQYSTSELRGLLAIASTSEDYVCPTQKHYFPVNVDTEFGTFSDDFSTDFVAVNRSGAFLGIGYNADLTEITKSSIVSDPLPLQRGNYSFTARIATGENIITTVALITDSVAVPFNIDEKPVEVEFDESVFENMTGLEAPETNVTDTLNITSTVPTITTRKAGAFVPTNTNASNTDTNFDNDEYGFGIHFLGYKIAANKNWHHQFWARNKFTSIQRWFSVPFDPSSENHRYTVLVEKKSEYLETTLDLTLIVDGEEIINIAGFKFYGDMKISALTWNEDGYKPPIENVYHPFYSDAIINKIDIPDEKDKMCRHGRGFYDEESSVKEIWLGVSDSKFEFGNVVSLSHYKTFCYPCKGLCQSLCKQPCSYERLSGGFDLIPLEVNGLNMESPNIEDTCSNVTSDSQCNSTAYYINVKVVNFAGIESLAYSNAIQIDLTPPECEYVKCLDPDYSEDEPTKHLGSSSNIGAYWNCSEDVSQIENYAVRIFDSSSNQTVMNSTSVGLKTKTGFKLGNGTFKDGKNYTVEVTTVNTAGLSVMTSCQVQVSLYPPDTSGAGTKPLYTEASDTPADEDTPYWTSSQTEIGIEWQGGNSQIEYYEWQIGTLKNGRDVFPPVKVGQKMVGSSAIVHGKLEFDKKAINKSVAEFRNMSGMTPEEIQNLTGTNEREKSFFNMEPGRCIHQSLYAIGYSHLKSKIQGKTVCVKRRNDIFLNGTMKKVKASKSKSSDTWSLNVVTEPQIVIDATLVAGGLGLGTLTKTDLSNDYGSAATADYKPFIADPETTFYQTSRLLRNRIRKLCNMTFYVSPSPLVEYERIGINVTVPKGCEKDPDYQPALMYWDNVNEQWVHIDEGCRDYLTAVMSSDIYQAELCKKNKETNTLTKRASTATLQTPKDFTLVQINRKFPNNPPTIITEVVHFLEDTSDEVLIQTVDLENDTLLFEITEDPTSMDCEITQNSSGKLNCTPFEDFYGTDYIKVKITETGLPPFEEALVYEKLITINVSGIPDKTDRYFKDPNGTVHSDIRPSMTKVFTVNANRSSFFSAGKILLADVDGNEVFTVHESFEKLGNSTFTLSATDILTIQLDNVTSRTYRSLEAYDVGFKFSPEESGNMSLKFIARTADGRYTPSMTVELYVLENPCIYGHCSPLGNVGCDDIKRSTSFADFKCVCNPGYEGEWCQTETNECQWEPCALMFDCEDLINAYKCNINIPKLMAILICSIIAIGGASFLAWKLIKRFGLYTVNKVTPSRVDLKEFEFNETFEMDEERPTTSGSILLEPAMPSTPAPSTSIGSFRLKSDGDDIAAVTSFTKAPGMMLPPHHAFRPKGFGPSKMVFKTGKLHEDILKPKDLDKADERDVSSQSSVETSNRSVNGDLQDSIPEAEKMDDAQRGSVSSLSFTESPARSVTDDSASGITKIDV